MLQPRNLSGALLAGWRRSVPPLIGSSECDPRPGPRIMEDQLHSDALTQELLVWEILTLNVDKWYFSSILACIKKGEMSIQCGPFHLIQHLLLLIPWRSLCLRPASTDGRWCEVPERKVVFHLLMQSPFWLSMLVMLWLQRTNSGKSRAIQQKLVSLQLALLGGRWRDT